MKRSICGLLAALTFSTSLSAAAFAAPPVNLHSGNDLPAALPGLTLIDEIEMQAIDGGIILLPWIFGIAGIDMALITMYWGMYVPNYAEKDGIVTQLQ